MMHSRTMFPATKAGFFISMVLVLILSACATPTETVEPTQNDTDSIEVVTEELVEPTSIPTDIPEPIFIPQEFVDALDRNIVIDTPPLKIVSLAPSVTEALFAIGAGDLLIGRTEYCDFPSEAELLPTIGGYAAKSISIEAILDLEPDLVIGGSTRQGEIIEALENSGIQTFIVQPKSIDEIIEVLDLLGMVTDRQAGAEVLIADIEGRINTVTEVISTIPDDELVSVFYEVWHEPLMTTTLETFIGEIIQLAGGINIFADIEEAYPAVSAEQILASDPDVILGPSSHGDQLTIEIISTREGWQDLISVQNEAIYLIEGNMISRSGPRIIDAMEAIAEILYPAYFGE